MYYVKFKSGVIFLVPDKGQAMKSFCVNRSHVVSMGEFLSDIELKEIFNIDDVVFNDMEVLDEKKNEDNE